MKRHFWYGISGGGVVGITCSQQHVAKEHRIKGVSKCPALAEKFQRAYKGESQGSLPLSQQS